MAVFDTGIQIRNVQQSSLDECRSTSTFSAPQTICNTFIFPLELAATTIFDFRRQHTLETNCPILSAISFPETGSTHPNL
ncbi:hypothetical protein OIU74_007607 [Salix koriyanagi]|uniref:Uncharacterized protein n=1 Tax=Salix koriyanagi TaxID=2511006 RepID=A0A9Q0U3Y1_9ROSI|nr:hypothetical protein OIU74_007607 [Salix koriyanagi]